MLSIRVLVFLMILVGVVIKSRKADSKNISMFFKEHAAASEKILTTASEIYLKRKCAAASLRIMST